jgi:hypothetical protein
MPEIGKIQLGWKAIRELGIQSTGWLAIYHLGLISGHYRRSLPKGTEYPNSGFDELESFKNLPEKIALSKILGADKEILLNQAKEILNGKFRPFSGEPERLTLTPLGPLCHWTDFETGKVQFQFKDIKFVWEPCRFGWAYILAQAFHLTGDEKYSLCFWEYFELFEKSNPPYFGANWISGQEVGIRLIGLTFAASIFNTSKHSTKIRQQKLVSSIVNHAQRIKLTLPYARAQRNNHLLSEAVGLFTAGVTLPRHPQSSNWKQKGWNIFNQAIADQIDDDGTFIQQSMNYHRLMLHDALWFYAITSLAGMELPKATKEKLGKSVLWLMAQMEISNGETPNLGHNDGSNFLKLDLCEYSDYRPVVQAGSVAFLGRRALSNGIWDESCLWLGLNLKKSTFLEKKKIDQISVHKLQKGKLKLFLRTAKFFARPAHADQLHVDIWWDGINIARDAGTYQYNLPAPWNNALGKTLVHNTITVDKEDQMTWAGKFLWLDWAQARIIENSAPNSIKASHNGYRKRGIEHVRQVKLLTDHEVEVVDEILVPEQNRNEHAFWLHWLLPDIAWKLDQSSLLMSGKKPMPLIKLKVECSVNGFPKGIDEFQIIRAGINQIGKNQVSPILGWYSAKYGQKIPAISFRVCVYSKELVTFKTQISFSAAVKGYRG